MARRFGSVGVLTSMAGVVMAVSLSACAGSVHRSVVDSMFFRPVECTISPYSGGASPVAGSTSPSSASPAEPTCHSENAQSVPSTPPDEESAAATVILPYFYSAQRFVLGPADLGPAMVARASVITGQGAGYQLQLDLTAAGTAGLNQVAGERRHSGTQEAFEVNGVVLSTSAFDASANNGVVVVAGPATTPFSRAQAEALAQRIDGLSGGARS
jgi:hypothetical protein